MKSKKLSRAQTGQELDRLPVEVAAYYQGRGESGDLRRVTRITTSIGRVWKVELGMYGRSDYWKHTREIGWTRGRTWSHQK